MALRFWIRLAEIALVLLLAGAVILSWREARSDRAELQSQLAAANQSLSAATGRQHARDAKLDDVLSSIAAQKKAAATPDQLLAGIAREAGLPTPLLLQSAAAPSAEQSTAPGGSKSAGKSKAAGSLQDSTTANGSSSGNPLAAAQSVGGAANAADSTTSSTRGPTPGAAGSADSGPPSAPEAKIPAADFRPLYDYVLDCKSCQAKLTAAQADLADEKSKTTTLTKSRDDAVRAAKGGSIWKRACRAAKWFAIGAAVGAIASKTVR